VTPTANLLLAIIIAVTLRLLSYNIWYGGKDRLPAILDVVREQQPDVVALQEANSRPNAEYLADALGMQLVYGEANSPFAVAWLSRLPIVSSQNHRLPLLAKTLLQVEVEWNGAPLQLFGTHLVAGRTEQDGAQRAEEAQAIVEQIGTLGQAGVGPHLLVGDFNALHPDDGVAELPDGAQTEFLARRPIEHVLEAGYVDSYRQLHPDGAQSPGYTYAASHPWVRIDFIFTSPDLAGRLRRCDVIMSPLAARASDHLPMLAELE
jgi:exodeoxyribonuclease-3